MQCLEWPEHDPARLTSLTHADHIRRGGAPGAESSRGSDHYRDGRGPGRRASRREPGTKPQREGIDEVERTYPFDLHTSVRALRLNRFFGNPLAVKPNASRHAALLWMGAWSLLTHAGTASAQAPYPARPVRLVVAYPAGTSADVVARLWGDRFSRATGQAVVVDNKPGASSIIGTQAVMGAPADGHTLLEQVRWAASTGGPAVRDSGAACTTVSETLPSGLAAGHPLPPSARQAPPQVV